MRELYNWEKFRNSGKINDYIEYVNSLREDKGLNEHYNKRRCIESRQLQGK